MHTCHRVQHKNLIPALCSLSGPPSKIEYIHCHSWTNSWINKQTQASAIIKAISNEVFTVHLSLHNLESHHILSPFYLFTTVLQLKMSWFHLKDRYQSQAELILTNQHHSLQSRMEVIVHLSWPQCFVNHTCNKLHQQWRQYEQFIKHLLNKLNFSKLLWTSF